VVEVRVRENDGVDLFRRHGCVAPVAFTPFFWTLKETAIDEDFESVFAGRIACIHQVL